MTNEPRNQPYEAVSIAFLSDLTDNIESYEERKFIAKIIYNS